MREQRKESIDVEINALGMREILRVEMFEQRVELLTSWGQSQLSCFQIFLSLREWL